MKKRYSEEQIIGFLREADASIPVEDLKLIRFRGHPILLESGGHDAEIKNALLAGVPAQDCRTG